jgi:hypothetical protein
MANGDDREAAETAEQQETLFMGAPFGSSVDGETAEQSPAPETAALGEDPLLGEPFEGEPFAGEPFAGETFAGEPFAGADALGSEAALYGEGVADHSPTAAFLAAEEEVLLAAHHREPRVERTVFRVIATLATAAVILAVVSNVLWSPAGARIRGGGLPASAGGPEVAPVEVKLEKPAISLLPAQILAHETLAHHPVPGQGDISGEAIYATLNMNLEAMVPVGVYARAEGFASDEDARQRLNEIMAPYQTRAESLLASGVTPVEAGFSEDLGAYVVGWTRGPYAIFVKTHFKDKIPADKRDFLRNQSKPVVDAIDLFQRTGQEGLQLGKSPTESETQPPAPAENPPPAAGEAPVPTPADTAEPTDPHGD